MSKRKSLQKEQNRTAAINKVYEEDLSVDMFTDYHWRVGVIDWYPSTMRVVNNAEGKKGYGYSSIDEGIALIRYLGEKNKSAKQHLF